MLREQYTLARMNTFILDNLQLFRQTSYILPAKLIEICSHQFPTYYHQTNSQYCFHVPNNRAKPKETHQFLLYTHTQTRTHPNMQEKPFSLQNLPLSKLWAWHDKYRLLIKIRWIALHWEAKSTRRNKKNPNQPTNHPKVCFLSWTEHQTWREITPSVHLHPSFPWPQTNEFSCELPPHTSAPITKA